MWPLFFCIFNMERLRKNAQFSEVYRTHNSFADKFLIMYVRKNGESFNRVGVSISKKVGNSVIRHRLKRLIKESYRLHEKMFNSGLDIVVIARKGSDACDFAGIESALLHLMKLNGTLDTVKG